MYPLLRRSECCERWTATSEDDFEQQSISSNPCGAQAVLAGPSGARLRLSLECLEHYALAHRSRLPPRHSRRRASGPSAPERSNPQETHMPSLPGVDFLATDPLLNDEEKLARQSARQFVDEAVLPIIEKHNREATFPLELVPQLAALGFFGANLSDFGCAGLSNVAYGQVMQELERGDSGLRSFVSVQSALVMYPIHEFGSPAQKQKWLRRLQSGRAIGCFGLTEPQFGSNPGGMLTRAVRRPGHYVLNGEKMWITNGSIADVAVIWAKDEDDRVRGFLVEKGTRGFKSSDIHGKWSLRVSVTSSLALTDCEIPEENALPGAVGLRAALSCLTQARYGIGWGAI